MPGNGFELTNSFLEEFDMTFHPYLSQRGSQLMQACVQEPVQGAVKYVRFQNVGDAHWVTSHGDPTNYTTIEYDRRRLKPVGLECAITLDAYDMVQQGTPDPGMLAQQAANACGRKIDECILQGINGTAYTESQGEVVLSGAESVTAGASPAAVVANYDKTQTIAWNDATACGDLTDSPLITHVGLSTSKIAKAIKKLKAANNQVGPFVCVTNAHGMLSLRADKRAASTDFNDIHAFAQGVMNPYAGVDAFAEIATTLGGKSKANADGIYSAGNGLNVKYAWVYALPQIKLGCSMPLHMENGLNAERHLDQVLIYKGMYDCTRLYEESVVRIEVLEDVTQIAGKTLSDILAH